MATDRPSPRILIVDDEVYVRVIIRSCLEDYEVHVDEARGGREALAEMKKAGYDLVILDYNMPGLNGQEVINRMHLDEVLAGIPVVIYTAGGFEEVTEEWLRNSSAAYVEKAELGYDLIDTIRDILGSRFRHKDAPETVS